MDNFVARQAIFDRGRSVYGYELLFRSAGSSAFDGSEASFATSQVIASAVFSIGLDNMLCGKRAFINFGRNLLLGDWTTMLPSQSVVIEVLESVEPDSDVLEACRNLRAQGYLVALDDFICDPRFDPLTELADIIKVDFRITPREEQLEMLARYHARGVKMLAEKVETQEEFEWSRTAGYDYFQGYFFAKPVLLQGKQVPGFKTNHLKLLEQLQKPDLDFIRLEKLISTDVAFCYRVMRYVNSGAFARSTPVRSIRQALVILGERETRKWISLATLPALARDKPAEIVVHAMIRARFCELLAAESRPAVAAADASLMGMFSMLDAMIDRPLSQILVEMNLSAPITEALLNRPQANNPYSLILRLVQNYESATWEVVGELALQLGLEDGAVVLLYLDALRWSTDLFRDLPVAVPASVR
jgi:EAL and modified HD-GYP domain-containing signal transduction protein